MTIDFAGSTDRDDREVQLPDEGWWPEEKDAPRCQWLRRNGRSIAQVVRSGDRWRAFSMIELNRTGTSGKPLFDSVDTREEAKQQCEDYADSKKEVVGG